MTKVVLSNALAGILVALIGVAAALSGVLHVAPDQDAWAAALAALGGAGALVLSAARIGEEPQEGWYAGVARALSGPGRPVWAMRTLVVVAAPVGGLGVAAYAVAALVLALTSPLGPPVRIDGLRAAGTGFLGLAAVLAARAAGLMIGGDGLPWAVLLIGSGLALFWSAAGALRGVDPAELLHESRATRTSLGLLLAIAGAVWVLSRAGLFHQAAGAVAGTCVSLAVLALVVGPRWLRTSRALTAERTSRARAQERAELADHLHDSVLQTLALIQRRARDPAAVGALARRQERELRRWLLDEPGAVSARESFPSALRAMVADVEDVHSARVELVVVGDAPVDERSQALLGAAREALTNAARHAPGSPVSLFAKLTPEAIEVFVHDRGPGFDPVAIAPGRRGVRESIIARVERHGGVAEVRSAPGEGCEVTLRLARR